MTKPADDRDFDAFVKVFASRLRTAMGDETVRAIGDKTGVAHTTLYRLLSAKHAPTFYVLWQLERYFGVDLWPGRVQTGVNVPKRRQRR